MSNKKNDSGGMMEDEPAAWLVPKILDFKNAKVHFTRAEGCLKTDDELKESIGGTVIFYAETVFIGESFVEDKYGVKHYPIPLYRAKPHVI